MSQAVYEIRLRNKITGDIVARYDTGEKADHPGIQFLTIRNRLRTPGGGSVGLNLLDPNVVEHLYLYVPEVGVPSNLDNVWEFWRRDARFQTNLERIHTVFHRGQELELTQQGVQLFRSYGEGLGVFAYSEPIAWPEGSPQSNKNGDIKTVVTEFVQQNIGVSAGFDSLGNSRVRPGLSVDIEDSSGLSWPPNGTDSEQSFRLLSDVLIDIANYCNGNFQILNTSDPISGPLTFSFKWRSPIFGLDRRQNNSDGNTPLVFSERNGSITTMGGGYSYFDIANVLYMLGSGATQVRAVEVLADQEVLALSPYIRMAISRTVNRSATAELINKGTSELSKKAVKRTFRFPVFNQEPYLYKRDWDIGDICQVEDFAGHLVDTLIIGVQLTIDSGGDENIIPEFIGFEEI